jgi:hypothetical protein
MDMVGLPQALARREDTHGVSEHRALATVNGRGAAA